MPIYTFICKDCGEKFDLLIGMTAERTELKCKECNSKNIKKLLASFSVGDLDNKSNSGGSCPTGTCPTDF